MAQEVSLDARIAALKGELDRLRPLSPQGLRSLEQWYAVELTYTSNAIEGNTLTRSETALVVEKGLTVGQGKPLRDHLEAINHIAALDYMKALAGSAAPIAEHDIRQIQGLILRLIDDEAAGRYARHGRMISGSDIQFPSPAEIPAAMRDLVEWLGRQPSTPDVAAEAHARLVSDIHPFEDGNGRTARILMNTILLRGGYSPVAIDPAQRLDYFQALEDRRHRQDPRPFADFIKLRLIESLARHVTAIRQSAPVQAHLAATRRDRDGG
ncbi:MAG TPA: Fic family protein [Roseomonas sp.]